MTIEIDKYEHFSFDMWLTLIRSHPEFKPKRDKWLYDYFGISIPFEDFRNLLRNVDIQANAKSEQTGIHIPQKELFSTVLKLSGVNLDSFFQWEPFLKELASLFLSYPPLLLDSSIASLFQEIQSKGKTISLLSNTAFITGSSLHKVLEYYDLAKYFSFELYSDEMGKSKPHPAVFALLIEKVNTLRELPKEQIIHIGDNFTADYQGALKAGIQGLWINNEPTTK